MSRIDYTSDLGAALDAFAVPALRAGFADRIVATATAPVGRSSSGRDRRGGWRMARRVAIGTLAAGMVSAAAVASGLLGAAGIRVPVLSAMLEPKPVPKPVIVKAKPVQHALVQKPPVAVTKPADPGLADPGSIAPPVDVGARLAQASERRAERRAFIAQHPELKPVVRQAMRQQRDFVQANPEVRQLWRMPQMERRAYLAEHPELRAAVRAHQAERRALIEANPEAAALFRGRIQERLAARRNRLQNQVDTPAPEGNATDPR